MQPLTMAAETTSPPWKQYEAQIADRLRQRATGPVKITADVKLPGRLSEVDRQIDLLVEGAFAGVVDAVMAVDCKCFSSKVDVKDMEAFIGLLEDVSVNMGMLITTVGFTPGAERRGAHVLQEVVPLVNIAIFDQLSSWWLMRAGERGSYVGDYLDHEPYGKFWWRVSFVTGDSPEDEEEDVLWASDAGGWDVEDGSRLFATILARHRVGHSPDAQEVENLAAALDREVVDGQGFDFSTRQIDLWMDDPEADRVERHGW